MTTGNEQLMARAGANVPDKPAPGNTGIGVGFLRKARALTIPLPNTGDTDLVAQPTEDNTSRRAMVVDPAFSSFAGPGAAGAEPGSGVSFSGEVYYIDKLGNEFSIGTMSVSETALGGVTVPSMNSGFNLLKGERLIFRPSAPDAQVGSFLQEWKDTDTFGIRTPISSQEAVVVEAPPGKYLLLASSQGKTSQLPMSVSAPPGVGSDTLELIIETAAGARIKVTDLSYSEDSIIPVTGLGSPTLAPGDKLIVKVASGSSAPSGPGVQLISTWAMLTAADQNSPTRRGSGTAI